GYIIRTLSLSLYGGLPRILSLSSRFVQDLMALKGPGTVSSSHTHVLSWSRCFTSLRTIGLSGPRAMHRFGRALLMSAYPVPSLPSLTGRLSQSWRSLPLGADTSTWSTLGSAGAVISSDFPFSLRALE